MGKRKKKAGATKPLPKPVSQSLKHPTIHQEINTIIQSSLHREKRLMTLGRLIFFSTETGDAWILDPDEGRARCLSLDGEKQPFPIKEGASGAGIEWDSEFRIKGSLFTVLEYSGPVRTILGYPTHQIEEAIRQRGV